MALQLLDDLIQNIGEKDDSINVIDTHIHLWNVDTAKRGWLFTKGLEELNRTYDFDQYYALYHSNSKVHLKYGLFMETDVDNNDIEVEVNEVTSICKNPNHNLNGLIMKLDPNASAKEFIKKVNQYKNNPYIKGLRRVLLGENLGDEIPKQFISNLQYLSERNDIKWTFDLCVNVKKLYLMETVVKSVPNMTFILDHMGNHHEICGDKELWAKWEKNLIKLSKYKNLNIKISGLSGSLNEEGKEWTFNVEREKIDFVIKHFCAENIVYGSDWPVSERPLNDKDKPLFLTKWTAQLYRYLKQKYGQSLCNRVFAENAIRIYNL